MNQSSDPIERVVEVTVTVRGNGSVLISGKRCRGVCRQKIKRGTVMSLVAQPNGSSFGGWEGACLGSSLTCQMSAFRDARGKPPSITARFT